VREDDDVVVSAGVLEVEPLSVHVCVGHGPTLASA
jgi:hypothetical protein